MNKESNVENYSDWIDIQEKHGFSDGAIRSRFKIRIEKGLLIKGVNYDYQSLNKRHYFNKEGYDVMVGRVQKK